MQDFKELSSEQRNEVAGKILFLQTHFGEAGQGNLLNRTARSACAFLMGVHGIERQLIEKENYIQQNDL